MGNENKKEKDSKFIKRMIQGMCSNLFSRFKLLEHKAVWVQAIATILLVFVTWSYVRLTRELVETQERQFKMLNAAEVGYVRRFGNINNGTIVFNNTGSLSAEDLKFIWKITKVGGKEVMQKVSLDKIDSKQEIQIRYNSDFKLDERVVFLIVAWKYKSQFEKEVHTRTMHFYWWWEGTPREWTPYATLGVEHDDFIRRKKEELIQILKQEENN